MSNSIFSTSQTIAARRLVWGAAALMFALTWPVAAAEQSAAGAPHKLSSGSAHPPHGGATAAQPGEQYVCPMHPEVVRGAPGKCPICGMFLEKKPAAPNR